MKIVPWHVGISVSNLTVSVPWYKRVLGFNEVRRSRVETLGAQICFLERDSFELELFQYDCPNALPEERRQPNIDLRTLGTKHLAFRVPDLAEMLKELERTEVDVALCTSMQGKQVCFIRDPDGVLIELIQPPEKIGLE